MMAWSVVSLISCATVRFSYLVSLVNGQLFCTYSELQELLALSEVASKKNIYTVQINETEHDREKIYVPAVQYKGRRLIHIFSSDLQP